MTGRKGYAIALAAAKSPSTMANVRQSVVRGLGAEVVCRFG
ncbi:MAG TPA: hypothetical protein VFG87_16265 [Amycolatopsis sp.]|nr:hypothetical protein [Amycolatopsis sp.]